VTLSPAAGTLRSGQVAGSDQRLTACAPAVCAWATVTRLPSSMAGTSDARRVERYRLLIASTPDLRFSVTERYRIARVGAERETPLPRGRVSKRRGPKTAAPGPDGAGGGSLREAQASG